MNNPDEIIGVKRMSAMRRGQRLRYLSELF
jgi:hypothetical protein